MVVLTPGALPSNIGPYAAVMAAGFVIGITGHIMRSRMLIVAGILIVGTVSVVVAFVLGRLG
jgi:hypothetical protein